MCKGVSHIYTTYERRKRAMGHTNAEVFDAAKAILDGNYRTSTDWAQATIAESIATGNATVCTLVSWGIV